MAPRARPVSGVFPFNRDIWIFYLVKVELQAAPYAPETATATYGQLKGWKWFPWPHYTLADLTLLKKYVIILKKGIFFQKWKRSALNYHKMELQLNTVPQKIILQGAYAPKGKEVAARRLSVAQTGVKVWTLDFFKNLCYNRIDTLKIFRAESLRSAAEHPPTGNRRSYASLRNNSICRFFK